MVRPIPTLLVATLLAVPLTARGGEAEELKLKAAFEQAVSALNAGNVDGFLDTVHEKALSFYSCGPTSGKEGKEACQLDWQRFFSKTSTARFEPKNMQYRVFGDTGVAWGDYDVAVKGRNGKETKHSGRYTLTYTKTDGQWRVIMQHNTPASQLPSGPAN